MSHEPTTPFLSLTLEEFQEGLAAAAANTALEQGYALGDLSTMTEATLQELLDRLFGQLVYLDGANATSLKYWVVDADGKYIAYLEDVERLREWLLAVQEYRYEFEVHGDAAAKDAFYELVNRDGGFIDHLRSRFGGSVPLTIRPYDQWRQSYYRSKLHFVQPGAVRYPRLFSSLMRVYAETLPAGGTFRILMAPIELAENASSGIVAERAEVAIIPDASADDIVAEGTETLIGAYVFS